MSGLDLVGMRYGILTVLERAPTPPRGQGWHWSCKCDCGTVKVARAKDLRNGNTASCGCRKNPKRPPAPGKGKGWRDPNLMPDLNRPWRKDEQIDDRWLVLLGQRCPPSVVKT